MKKLAPRHWPSFPRHIESTCLRKKKKARQTERNRAAFSRLCHRQQCRSTHSQVIQLKAKSVVVNLRSVSAIVITDFDGNRIASRCYVGNSAEVTGLERKLRTFRKESLVVLDDHVCLLDSCSDLKIFVIGFPGANELLLEEVMKCMTDMLKMLFGDVLCSSLVLENLHAVYLVLDEVCDRGILLEPSAKVILDRMKEGTEPTISEDLTVGELITLGQRRLKALIK